MLDSDELEKYTSNELSLSTLKQSLIVPYEYDVNVLFYFLKTHFPTVEVIQGKDEMLATLHEMKDEKLKPG